MPKYFIDLKNVRGVYANKFYGLEKLLGGGLCRTTLFFNTNTIIAIFVKIKKF